MLSRRSADSIVAQRHGRASRDLADAGPSVRRIGHSGRVWLYRRFFGSAAGPGL
jgi:hypothetical protein